MKHEWIKYGIRYEVGPILEKIYTFVGSVLKSILKPLVYLSRTIIIKPTLHLKMNKPHLKQKEYKCICPETYGHGHYKRHDCSKCKPQDPKQFVGYMICSCGANPKGSNPKCKSCREFSKQSPLQRDESWEEEINRYLDCAFYVGMAFQARELTNEEANKKLGSYEQSFLDLVIKAKREVAEEIKKKRKKVLREQLIPDYFCGHAQTGETQAHGYNQAIDDILDSLK